MKIAPLFTWIAVTIIALLILAVACSDNSVNPSDSQRPPPIASAPTAPGAISKPTPRPTSTLVSDLDVIAMQMAVISGKDNSVTRQRFKSLIPRFVEICPEMPNSDRASNHLVIAYNELEEAGLSGEEGLIDVSNNLYWIVTSVDTFVSSNNIPMPRCIELFAMYTTLRYQAWSSQEAREGVVDVTIGLYNLGQ